MCRGLRKIVDIIQMIGPILAILALSITIGKAVMDGTLDEKKTKAKIKNTIVALIMLFLIPLSINLILENVDGDISSCWKGNKLATGGGGYQETGHEGEKKKQEGEHEKGTTEEAHCPVKNDKGNGKVEPVFTKPTMVSVESHYTDFNYTNSKASPEYIKSLGGIFKKHYGKKEEVKTAKQFQEIAEYVFGLMTIYGFDYYNPGMPIEEINYCKWGSSCIPYEDLLTGLKERENNEEEPTIELPSGDIDAFYPGKYFYHEHGNPNAADFDSLIIGDNMTTNCSLSVDMVYYKAGLMGKGEKFSGSADAINMGKNYKIITKMNELYIGDIIHFFEEPINQEDPNTWTSWKHVAFVGEVDAQKRIVTFYDGGSSFTARKNFKWTHDMDDTPEELGGFPGWVAVRPFKIKEQVCDNIF